MILKKLLLTTFYVTTSFFSSIRFAIIPSTSKLAKYFTSVFFTRCFATQQVDATFAVTVNIMFVLFAITVNIIITTSITYYRSR